MGYNSVADIIGLSSSVAQYHGTTAVPFFYGTSTVGFTVLFSTAIPHLKLEL